MKRRQKLFTRRWRSKVSSFLLAIVLWLILRQAASDSSDDDHRLAPAATGSKR